MAIQQNIFLTLPKSVMVKHTMTMVALKEWLDGKETPDTLALSKDADGYFIPATSVSKC